MGYIPFGYLADFFQFLSARSDIQLLTYADLEWNDDWDAAGGYPAEARAWRQALRNGTRDPGKAYVLLQHDVDSLPERTLDALRVQERLGLRSNVMIFNRRIDRRRFQESGEIAYTAYIDDEARAYLQSLTDKGFVIGYHCNAYERSGFSPSEAQRIIGEDVAELRRHYRLEFMSAHGGPRDAIGRSNHALALPSGLMRQIRWVHNRYTPSFDDSYTDGGMNSGRPAEEFDLRRFVQSMRPGGRYRVLLHPQYYAHEFERNPRLTSPWYEDVLRRYATTNAATIWEGVAPSTRAEGFVSRCQRQLRRFGKRIRRR